MDVVERYYLGVTRFTTSSFMRAKLGDALSTSAFGQERALRNQFEMSGQR